MAEERTVIGIDAGISTTKIVGVRGGKVIAPTVTRAADPVASLYGALGKYLYDNGIDLGQVERIMLTGAGSAFVEGDVYGIRTERVGEFEADARGAEFGSGLRDMLVVSMGTGTTFIEVRDGKAKHLGGMGIGGGTLAGLARAALGTDDLTRVAELAAHGDPATVNLCIGDISPRPLPGLPLDATASLFGRTDGAAGQEDIAAGLLWTVVQTIGSAAVLASRAGGLKDFVMIGGLTQLGRTREVLEAMEPLYGVRFTIPDNADFCTAIGAAMTAAGTK